MIRVLLSANAVLLLLVARVDVTWGFGTGAPATACETMIPTHGIEQTTTNPHTIVSNADFYVPGEPIQVNITGTFKGILLQANDEVNPNFLEPLGSWTVKPSDDLKINTSCGTDPDHNSVTHSSESVKTDLVLQYIPPMQRPNGSLTTDPIRLRFYATIADEKDTWWRTYYMGSLSQDSRPTIPTTITTDSTTTDNTTTAGSGASRQHVPTAPWFAMVVLLLVSCVFPADAIAHPTAR